MDGNNINILSNGNNINILNSKINEMDGNNINILSNRYESVLSGQWLNCWVKVL